MRHLAKRATTNTRPDAHGQGINDRQSAHILKFEVAMGDRWPLVVQMGNGARCLL
jgi:hypothetical protein